MSDSVEDARYRVKVARQNLRHSKANSDAYKVELRQAKLALTDAKVIRHEHQRRGKDVRQHEMRVRKHNRKGWFETEDQFRTRQRAEVAEEAPLR